MRRSVLALGAASVLLALYACSPAGGGGGEDAGDDGAAADASPDTSPTVTPDVSAPPVDAAQDVGTPLDAGDAGDAATGVDGATDSGVDAADGAVTDAAADAGTPPVTSVVNNVLDYDLNDTHLLVRQGTQVSSCALPGCSPLRPLVTVTTGSAGNILARIAASSSRFFFFRNQGSVGQTTLHSIALDHTGMRNENAISWMGQVLPQTIFIGVTRITTGYICYPLVSGTPQPQGRQVTITTPRVGAIGVAHENYGSLASISTRTAPIVTGASLPALATAASAIGTSARGATVPYPTTVILRDGNLEACTTSTDCAAWVNLGALGNVFNLDGENLYVGSATGLGKCALAEIATAGTCTLAPLVSGETIAGPMYVTATHVWFLSGNVVKNVPK